MEIIHTKRSRKDFQKLPSEIQRIAEKQFRIFLTNPNRPSLRIKKVQGTKDIWEGSITKGIRFTFEIAKDGYILRRIGKHDEVLKKP